VLHSAIVSVRTTPFFTEYVLGNLDDDLRMLLPGTKIIEQTPGSLFFQNVLPEHSTSLMKAIIKSISTHLHVGKIN
jgi:hypothetical protein